MDAGRGSSHSPDMNRLPPFRDRTPTQLREQAQVYRRSAAMASGKEAENLIRIAERYEAMAVLKDGAEAYRVAC